MPKCVDCENLMARETFFYSKGKGRDYELLGWKSFLGEDPDFQVRGRALKRLCHDFPESILLCFALDKPLHRLWNVYRERKCNHYQERARMHDITAHFEKSWRGTAINLDSQRSQSEVAMLTKKSLKKMLMNSKPLVYELSLKERYEAFEIMMRAARTPTSYCQWLKLIERISLNVITTCKSAEYEQVADPEAKDIAKQLIKVHEDELQRVREELETKCSHVSRVRTKRED